MSTKLLGQAEKVLVCKTVTIKDESLIKPKIVRGRFVPVKNHYHLVQMNLWETRSLFPSTFLFHFVKFLNVLNLYKK